MPSTAALCSNLKSRSNAWKEVELCKPDATGPHQSFHLSALRDALRGLDRRVARPDHNTFALLLEQCCKLKALGEGKRVHAHMSRLRLDNNTFLANFLISMYGKCGSVVDSRLVFDTMPRRNVVSWNAMISVYAEHGQGKKALRLVRQMLEQEEGMQPKKSTYLSALNGCVSPEILPALRILHESVENGGYEKDLVIGNALINAYGKCGSPTEACKMFREMQVRDIITWNSMIAAFAQNGHGKQALRLFYRMKAKNLDPDKVSFVNLLSGCTNETQLGIGRTIYELIKEHGYQCDVFVGTALITMFGKCGSVEEAYKSFESIKHRTVVSWNAMIVAYVQCGCKKEAIGLFQRMKKELVKPDKVTFVIALDACTDPADLEVGRGVHSYARECKLDGDVRVRSALVNMYGNCGCLQAAVCVFRTIQPPDLVSWTAMIGAYAHLGHGEEAFEHFVKMHQEGMKPNQVTYINLLSACALLCAFVEGKIIHACLIEGGFDSFLEVANALINMYSKCGSVYDARKVFTNLPNKNVVSWTSMLDTYSSHGYGKDALQVFRHMQQDGIKPDDVTFVSVLTACSHSGMLQEARETFFSMSLEHGIMPKSSHYACMIDMFARVGRLDEAERFISNMPFKCGVVEWMALLGACKSCGDVRRAEHAAEQVIALDPQCSGAYISLWNIYTENGRLDDAARLRTLMMKHGVKIDLDHK